MADDKDDAQVKNELGAIKAQLTATANPAELARLASAAAGLAASTNDPKLLEQIKSVQAAITKKEETAEQNISSKIAAENLEAPQQQHDPEIVREQELHERHESLKASHAQSMQDASEYIEQKKKENENFQGLLNDLREGKEITPERLQSFIKTPEQIKEDSEKEKAIKEAQQRATQHYQEMQAQEEEYKKQRTESAKQAEEQRKTNEKLAGKELEQGQQKLAALDSKTQQTDVKLEALRPKVEEAKKMKDDIDKEVKELEKINEKEQDNVEKIREEINKHKEKNPQIYNSSFDDFSTLLLNQTEAVKTGEIKDLELRNKFGSKEDNKEPTIIFPGKPGPDITLPGKENLPPSQKPIVAETSAATQKLSQEGLELVKNRPAPKDKVHEHASKMQTALEKQQPSAINKKETHVNKLARANQQNKKNEGHTR